MSMTIIPSSIHNVEQQAEHIRQDSHIAGREAIEKLQEIVRQARENNSMTNPVLSHLIEDRLTEIAENVCIATNAIIHDRVLEPGKWAEKAREKLDEDSDTALDKAAQIADETDWQSLNGDQAVATCESITQLFLKDWAELTQQAEYEAAQNMDDTLMVQQEMFGEAVAMILGLQHQELPREES